MSSTMPSISVVVPVYNGAGSIAACIEKLVKQDYPSYEIIVVENGSTDNTTEIVEKYPVKLLHSPERGPAAARNMGIRCSKADIIAFTDADCLAEQNWLSELVKPYASPEIGGVGGPIMAYKHDGRNIVEQFSDELSPLTNFVSGKNEFLPHLFTANASYRRSILVKIGGFNVHLVTGQDVDIAWRSQLDAGTKLAYAPQAVIYHHHRETLKGLARQYRRYGYGEIILDTIYGRFPNYPRDRNYQLRRIAKQGVALARYSVSMLVRRVKRLLGRASDYDVAVPMLRFIIEKNNITGKIEALRATHMMTSAETIKQVNRSDMITQLYGRGKE